MTCKNGNTEPPPPPLTPSHTRTHIPVRVQTVECRVGGYRVQSQVDDVPAVAIVRTHVILAAA